MKLKYALSIFLICVMPVPLFISKGYWSMAYIGWAANRCRENVCVDAPFGIIPDFSRYDGGCLWFLEGGKPKCAVFTFLGPEVNIPAIGRYVKKISAGTNEYDVYEVSGLFSDSPTLVYYLKSKDIVVFGLDDRSNANKILEAEFKRL